MRIKQLRDASCTRLLTLDWLPVRRQGLRLGLGSPYPIAQTSSRRWMHCTSSDVLLLLFFMLSHHPLSLSSREEHVDTRSVPCPLPLPAVSTSGDLREGGQTPEVAASAISFPRSAAEFSSSIDTFDWKQVIEFSREKNRYNYSKIFRLLWCEVRNSAWWW